MKVGDLVRFWLTSANTSKGIGKAGIVTAVSDDRCSDNFILASIKVRWTDHSDSEREWYRKDELVKL